MTIRPAQPDDLDAVTALESAFGDVRWPRAALEREWSKSHARIQVAINGERLCGYGVVWMVGEELQLANLLVHPDERRRGTGEAIVLSLLGIGVEAGCRECWLEVRAGNTVAQSFYRKMGFVSVGNRRGFYEHPTEDAVVMKKNL